jgi:hypothetical protein
MKSEFDMKTLPLDLPGAKAPGRGGRRSGAGRKGLDEGGTIVTTIRLTGEQRATLDLLGGVQHIRDYLQAVIENKIRC